MTDRLQEILNKYEELMRQLADSDTASDPEKLAELMKKQASMEPAARLAKEAVSAKRDAQEAREMLDSETDAELVALLKAEEEDAGRRAEKAEEELSDLLRPEDPRDSRDVYIEVRAGTGGEEAALFAADLCRMYIRFADRRHWRARTVSASDTGLGGVKEAILQISGHGAWSALKYESGVHRVQRVPVTESGGRIHTSTATVAILPESDDSIDIRIDPKDIRIDVFRATGNGGQGINTTDSAVRLTHIPTGIVISSQDERSQLQNKEHAMKILKAKLTALEIGKRQNALAENRRSQIGSGDRSEKIRTYNFPQSRVTDHRIHYTSHRINDVMDGDLSEFTERLAREEHLRQIEDS
ncbi:MAG: peptide chain release factor 1 [Lachnospiraceae bacterium]|jgi:peptide chain release factor 1